MVSAARTVGPRPDWDAAAQADAVVLGRKKGRVRQCGRVIRFRGGVERVLPAEG